MRSVSRLTLSAPAVPPAWQIYAASSAVPQAAAPRVGLIRTLLRVDRRDDAPKPKK